jgi:hypothetical protein
MTTTNHTLLSGEDAANGAIGEREAWDGDSKESRTAFRAYDSIAEPVSRKTSWQIWRDACAWQASRAALPAEKVAAEPVAWRLRLEDGSFDYSDCEVKPSEADLSDASERGRQFEPLYAAQQQSAQSAEQDERAALLREAVGLLKRVRLVHTGESRNPKLVEQAVKDFLAVHGDEQARAASTQSTQSTATQPAQTQVALTAAPRYREWLHLTQVGMWTTGVPNWARDHDGRMNDGIAMRSVIEELAALLAAQSVSGGDHD